MSSEGPPEAKKQKLDPPTDSGDASESEIGTDKETQKALQDIDSIQNEIDGLNEKASEEILEVEKKYKKLRKPYFDKRDGIIEHIPNFWVQSLLNHPQIAAVVNPKEKECLQYLSKVDVEEAEDIKSGYKLTFSFKANPYFTNEVLCKEFHLAETGDTESKSTPIDWKDGMDLIKFAQAASIPGMGNKRRPLRHSFFKWFLDNIEPSVDTIAEVIKDDMWPNPLQYYLVSEGEVDENGMGDSDDEDELDESVVVVEDDDDDDEDEEIYEVEDEDDEELDTTGDVEVIEEEEVGAEELEDEGDEECVEEIGDSKGKDNKEKDVENGDNQSVSKDVDGEKD